MLIRPIRPAELDTAAQVLVAAYRSIGHEDPAYLAELAAVGDRAAAVDTQVLVATEITGDLVGCVTFITGPSSPWAEFNTPGDKAEAAGFRMLGVDPQHSGQGVGGYLVSACLAEAQRAGKRLVVAHSTPAMVAAHHLYERLGFERLPDRDFSPRPGIDLWAFGRVL